MNPNNLKTASACVHAGTIQDTMTGGVNSPIFPSTAIEFNELTGVVYPRYFNTANQKGIAEKLAALEKGEEAMIFSSGMAAIFSTILGVVNPGDHLIFQSDLYGGTHYLITSELGRLGIATTLVDSHDIANFENALQPRTKAVYIETPSNPLLKITDVAAVAAFAQQHGLISMIDNTFASPINQNPIAHGIDIVLHSGTKYLGGHSDLCFGAVVASAELVQKIRGKSVLYGGSLNALDCYLIERSLKTLAVRVEQQNRNALALARFLEGASMVRQVYYPGLENHPSHALAGQQMRGFGGMLSFELRVNHSSELGLFLEKLELIRPAVSLGGVESTVTVPSLTSHAKMTAEERESLGISDSLLRLSVGIEAVEDLQQDLRRAFEAVENHSLIA